MWDGGQESDSGGDTKPCGNKSIIIDDVKVRDKQEHDAQSFIPDRLFEENKKLWLLKYYTSPNIFSNFKNHFDDLRDCNFLEHHSK